MTLPLPVWRTGLLVSLVPVGLAVLLLRGHRSACRWSVKPQIFKYRSFVERPFSSPYSFSFLGESQVLNKQTPSSYRSTWDIITLWAFSSVACSKQTTYCIGAHALDYFSAKALPCQWPHWCTGVFKQVHSGCLMLTVWRYLQCFRIPKSAWNRRCAHGSAQLSIIVAPQPVFVLQRK